MYNHTNKAKNKLKKTTNLRQKTSNQEKIIAISEQFRLRQLSYNKQFQSLSNQDVDESLYGQGNI